MMSFSFLNPWMLLGLGVLVVPIVLHLIRREERHGTPFPSLMFLKRVPLKTRRRRRLRNPLLLALRCLLLMLLVLAFAEPRLQWPDAPPVVSSATRDVVFLLDRSYSMAYSDRWQSAVSLLIERIESLPAGARAALVAFDLGAAVVQEFTDDRSVLRAAVERIEPGSGSTNFSAALDAANTLLARDPAPAREVIVVSDLQRAGLDSGQLRLDEGVQLTLHAVGGQVGTNWALLSAELTESSLDSGQRLRVSVRHTAGDAELERPIALTVDGHQIQSETMHLPRSALRQVEFPLVVPAERPSLVQVSLADDALSVDNSIRLVVMPSATVRALVVSASERESSAALFVSEALALSPDPRVHVKRHTARGGVQPADAFDIAIFVDGGVPSGTGSAGIAEFVKSGGGVLVVAGQAIPSNWPGDLDAVLPGRFAGIATPSEGIARLMDLDTGHPVFSALAEPRQFDLSTAPVYRYLRLVPRSNDAVIARYGNGEPALLERRVGRGRVLVLTAGLEAPWSGLGTEPGFLPFMVEAVRHLAAKAPAPQSVTVGTPIDLHRYVGSFAGAVDPLTVPSDPGELVLETPGGQRAEVSKSGVLVPSESGYYEIHPSTRSAGSVPLAVNPDTRESDLRSVTVEEFQAHVDRVKRAARVSADPRAAKALSRSKLWWYVLACALALTLLESVASRVTGRARPKRELGRGSAYAEADGSIRAS